MEDWRKLKRAEMIMLIRIEWHKYLSEFGSLMRRGVLVLMMLLTGHLAGRALYMVGT